MKKSCKLDIYIKIITTLHIRYKIIIMHPMYYNRCKIRVKKLILGNTLYIEATIEKPF